MHPDAVAILAWMGGCSERLRELLEQETVVADDLSPLSDASVRAHLRFVGEALAAHAAPGDPGLSQFGERLPDLFDERTGLLDERVTALGEAHAFEAGKQFGREAGDDPSNQVVVERRVRLNAWIAVFLDALDAVRTGDPIAAATAEWMAERQTDLANLIFTMDRRAKEIRRDREGEASISDPDAVNRIGQTVVMQAHSRFVVEAICATLR